jgi:flagellar FliJ protein
VKGFRLASVLRVRRVQEEISRAQLIRANADARTAWTEAQRREMRLAARRGPVDGAAAGYLGSITAGLARASDLSAARAAHQLAADTAADRAAGWTEAAARVQALEDLEDRHRAHEIEAQQKAEQKESDDRSATRLAKVVTR